MKLQPTMIAVLAAAALATPAHAAPWTFDLREVVTHEAWIGTETAYLLMPHVLSNRNGPLRPSPGLPTLTYQNDKGFPTGPLLVAIDLSTGRQRWARAIVGEYEFVLDPGGRDLWALSTTFDRLDAATGQTTRSVPFAPRPAPEREQKDPWRQVNALRSDGRVTFGSTRFGRTVNDPVRAYDIDTNELVEAIAVAGRSANQLDQFDLATDQSPELVQAHAQRRPIGGGNALWRYTTAGYSQNRPVVLPGDDVLMLSGMPDTVGLAARLDGKTGTPRWVTRLPRGAYAINQSQLKDGWYGVETWNAAGPLDAARLFAIGGDGTVYVLDAETGRIVGRAWVGNVILCPPKLVGDALVIVAERGVASVPMEVVLGNASLPAVSTQLDAARRALAARDGKTAAAAASAATDAWPTDAAAWRVLADAARLVGDDATAVIATNAWLELAGLPGDDWLRERFGLLARVDTGPINAPIASIGLFVYAPSTDGVLYVIDPDRLAVDERRTMGADAQVAVVIDNEFVRRGHDRRIERLLGLVQPLPTPLRLDPLFPAHDDHRLKPPLPDGITRPLPREWTTVGGKYGRAVTVGGRLVRPLQGGGVRELKANNEMVDRPSILDGVDRWRIDVASTPGVAPLGSGEGGAYALDDDLRPAKFLIDLRAEGTNSGMPAVLTIDGDGATLAAAIRRNRVPNRGLSIEIRSADGATLIRREPVLPPSVFHDLDDEPARLFKLGDGYFYAGGELAWIPLDEKRPAWRFRIEPGGERDNVRNRPAVDRSFGVPRLRDGKLFVASRFGGVFAFDVAAITR